MELSLIACNYLKACKVIFDHSFVTNRIKSHPNYPSLLSFTETLDELSIEYSAVRLEYNELAKANFPILVHIKQKDSSNFYIAKALSEIKKIEKMQEGVWSGITCMVQNKSEIKNNEHKELIKKKIAREKNVVVFSVFAGIAYILITISNFNLPTFIISFLSIIGCIVCYSIFIQSIGRSNQISKKFCGTSSSDSCGKVLTSNFATIFPSLTLSDIGFIYFTSLFIFLVWSSTFGLQQLNALKLLEILAFFSLLFTLYSIWYQARIVKQWCRLCLIVISILWIQAGIIFFQAVLIGHLLINDLSFQVILRFAFCLVISFLWLLIKEGITKQNLLEATRVKLLKWQRNPDIFLFLSKKQKVIESEIFQDEIVLGNVNAPFRFIVACSPYCGPCAQQHKQITELLNIHSEKVCITIRFVVNLNDRSDLKYVTVEEILRKYHAYQSRKDQLKLLEDWYTTMNLDTWRMKWQAKSNIKIDKILNYFSNWAKEENITHTPTTFLNGFRVPDQYEFKDFNYLINTLDEIISPTAIRSELAW